MELNISSDETTKHILDVVLTICTQFRKATAGDRVSVCTRLFVSDC